MIGNELQLDNFSGNHFEMGIKQGSTYKNKIYNTWEIFTKMEFVGALKPKMIPNRIFFYMAKNKATKTYKDIIERYAPNQAQRIRGISEGSGIDLKTLYLAQSAEPLLTRAGAKYTIPAAGCTSIGILPEKSASGETIIARNFDLFTAFIPMYVGRYNKIGNGFSNIDFSVCAFAGSFHGMNEKGLTITYDLAYPIDGLKSGVPISILIQEALEKYKTTEETIKFFKESLLGNGAILLVGDSLGDVRTLEISCNQIGIRKPKNGFIVNTNHFLTKEMKLVDVPENAVYSEGPLVGKRVRESTERRYERVYTVISNSKKVSTESLKNTMRDHGIDQKSSRYTICVHSPLISTTMSIIFDLSKRTISALIGNPCESEYKQFSF